MSYGQGFQLTDEYLTGLKIAANRLTQEISYHYQADSAMGIRVSELNGAVQRMEWQVERERGKSTGRAKYKVAGSS
jgi:hypothetical protein